MNFKGAIKWQQLLLHTLHYIIPVIRDTGLTDHTGIAEHFCAPAHFLLYYPNKFLTFNMINMHQITRCTFI